MRRWVEESASLSVVLRHEEPAGLLFTLHVRVALDIAERLVVLYRNAGAPRATFQVVPNLNGEAFSRFCFGSPIEFVAPLINAFAVVPGLAALIYVLKRLWGVDLELKTHRERLRAEFAEARLLAERAEDRLDEELFSDAFDTAVDILEERATAGGWRVERAVIFDQERDEAVE